MNWEARKKVLLDLFAAPTTLLPIVGGTSLLIGSWAFGLGSVCAFIGFAGIAIGVGIWASRLTFGLEELTKKAYSYTIQEQIKKQEARLNELHIKLTKDRDSRTQRVLSTLRKLYKGFKADVQEKGLTSHSAGILAKVEELFEACINQLEYSYDLWRTSKSLPADEKSKVKDQRDAVVKEIIKTVDHLKNIIEDYHVIKGGQKKGDLARLRGELEEKLTVTKRIEEELYGNEKKSYDESEFLNQE